MAPRGTLVDPAYQRDPHAEIKAAGGTLDPYHRRVTQFDVNQLHLDLLMYEKGVSYLKLRFH